MKMLKKETESDIPAVTRDMECDYSFYVSRSPSTYQQTMAYVPAPVRLPHFE